MAHMRMKKLVVEIPEDVIDELKKKSGKSAEKAIQDIILGHREGLHVPSK